jgi:hypothetical protein
MCLILKNISLIPHDDKAIVMRASRLITLRETDEICVWDLVKDSQGGGLTRERNGPLHALRGSLVQEEVPIG